MPKSEFNDTLPYFGHSLVAHGPTVLLGPDPADLDSDEEVIFWHVRQDDRVARGRVNVSHVGTWNDRRPELDGTNWRDGPAIASALQVYVGTAGIQVRTWSQELRLERLDQPH